MKMTTPLLLLAVLLTGCQTDHAFTDKHFQERVARIHTVGLIPEVHTGILNTYRGYEPSPAPFPDEPQIRSELIAASKDQLQRHGFVVIEGPPSVPTKEFYSGRMLQGMELRHQATDSDTTGLATNLNVDGLIFLNARVFKSTPHRQNITTPENTVVVLVDLGLIACAAVAGPGAGFPGGGLSVRSWQGAVIEITLVDGATGVILWGTGKDFGDLGKNKPSKAIEDLFTFYPKTNP